MSAVVSESLSLINQELLATLEEARQILEMYIDSDGEEVDLTSCADALHSAKGALQIAEAHGASLLAEEMEATCRLIVARDKSAPTDHGVEALTRAIVQLPAYIETIMVGGRDIPLVLLPLLNDLRAARSRPFLSESTLLLLDTGVSREEVGYLIKPQPNGEDIAALAKSLRTRFQLGLLGWIKGGSGDKDLISMAQVASRLEEASSIPDVHQLWWVIGGVIEALQDGGLDTGVAIKRLMGQADREIKRLSVEGERKYVNEPPTELTNNLLYYIARATTSGEQVGKIREAFNLNDLIPSDDQVEQLRQMLAAPSANLMRTVADAIRVDLANAKDALDIFARTGMDNVSDLEPQVEMLRKISDTLGVLGLARLRESVAAHSDELQDIVQVGSIQEDTRLVSLAASLLSVEDALDAELIALVEQPLQPAEADPDIDFDSDYGHVVQAVMRECVINLARIKDAISGVMGQTEDRADLNELEVLLSGINSGLAMLGKERALNAVDKVGHHILGFVREGNSHLPFENLNRLADAIVSLEYYMETIQNGRKEPLYMLDNAERCIESMDEAAITAAKPSTETEHDSATLLDFGSFDSGDSVKTEVLQRSPQSDNTYVIERQADRNKGIDSPADFAAVGVDEALANNSSMVSDVARSEATEISAFKVLHTDDGAPDSELLEVFLEEAKECIQTIQREFPLWHTDNSAEEPLATIRRSYHTLKGSGRMVGAELIGEYAWSVENLLNRIINNTIEAAPEILELLRQVVAMTPELIEQIEIGIPPSRNIGILIANAHGYADHGIEYLPLPLAESLPEASGDMLSPNELLPAFKNKVEAAVSAESSMDPVLLDILRKESATHIDALRSYVANCHASAPPFKLNKDIYRAAHTLHGSLRMAEATPAISLAEALNQLIHQADEHNAFLASDAIEVISDSADSLEQIIGEIDKPDALPVNTDVLVERIRLVHDALPAALREYELPAADESDDAKDHIIDEDEVPVAAFDPEIAAIFAEEASEILDAAEASLISLSNNENETAPLAELQRDLHTLKGGARMAGVAPMGDFSHEIEEFISMCADGRRSMTADAVQFLQHSFDELHRMRGEVESGRVVYPDAESARQLQALIDGDAANSTESTSSIKGDIPTPKEAFIPPAPDPEPEPEEVTIPDAADTNSIQTSDDSATPRMPPLPINDRLGELARDLGSPAVPADIDIVSALGIAAPPLLSDLLANAESDDEPEKVAEQDEIEKVAVTDPAADAPLSPIISETSLTEAAAGQAAARDLIRVDSAALEEMLNSAGEISIFHSRLNQQLGSIQFNLEELGGTVTRLREQLRAMDIETEAQILNRYKTESADNEEFDPLEMDRFSAIQQLSRALAESSNDVSSIKDLLQNLSRETESLLVQEARTVAELQDNLMRTRMVPFQQHVPRLSRLVRQIASEEHKNVDFIVEGSSGELDRQVLEKMLPPFEHMLRNAVVHGIELPDERRRLNKDETGHIKIRVRRDGSEVMIEVSDDGAGLNVDEIRTQASQQNDLSDTQVISDEAAMRLILKAGVTTAKQLTQSAGRGVGMDVVVNEVAKLGGSLGINSQPGQGCTFTIRLPYTLAVAQALIVQLNDETYALPVPSIEGVIRVSREEFDEHLKKPTPMIEYGDVIYTFRHLGQYLGLTDFGMPQDSESISLILVKTDEEAVALITDKTVDSREIVVKPVGQQLATVRGVSGATILGDGRIVIILDVAVLVRAMPMTAESAPLISDDGALRVPLAMVVDDSITMRRVSQRLLERRGLRVVTANDGIDALEKLEYETPDIVLLDIEMPRMDGYEFAKNLRSNPETAKVPVIMVTSRSGEKHRARAIELGVNDYLGKPYQEQEMLESVRVLLADKAPPEL